MSPTLQPPPATSTRHRHYTAATYTPRSSVSFLLKRSHALWVSQTEPVLAARGFTFIQYTILVCLRDGVTLTPKEISTAYRHDSGALTRVVDQLAERGLVDRIRDFKDRRKVNLQLTRAGHRAIESLIPLVVDALNRYLREFSRDEVRELSRLVSKFIANLQSGHER
jgi:DNA-binding MarR family transcriptional regulator